MAATKDPSPPSTPAPASSGTRVAAFRRIALALVAGIAILALARAGGDALPFAVKWVEELGFWGPVFFVGLYTLATVLFVPGSLLTLAGGALFGVAGGVAYVFTAAVLGSSAAFLIARYAARDRVARKLAAHPRFEALDRAVGEEGLKITFLLRLSPAFPFSFLNYALGLTRVRFRDYLIASLGMLPATFLYVYSGRVIGDVAQLAGGVQPERGLGYAVLVGLGLAATVAVTAVITRTARRALAEAAPLAEPSPGDNEEDSA